MPQDLTARQQAILDFMTEYTEEHGMPPTVREVADFFGMTPHGAYCHLVALANKGRVLRANGRSRAWRVAP